MSAFFIGQRVRILWSKNWPMLAGQEGTIVDIYTAGDDPSYPNPDEEVYETAPDSWGSSSAFVRGTEVTFGPVRAQLEPACDANTVIDWADCVWQPDQKLRRRKKRQTRRQPECDIA